MPRLLVVVDGTAEAAQALDRALDVAEAIAGSEIVLLGVEPEPPAWELRRHPPTGRAVREILTRANSSAAARGIAAEVRLETGEKSEVVTRIASQESCDQIFVSETRSTMAARAFLALSAACTGRVAGRIISAAGVPVTVVAAKNPR